MATSSITKNFFIRGKEQVDDFIDLLSSEPKPLRPSKAEFITNPDTARWILKEWKKNLKNLKANEK